MDIMRHAACLVVDHITVYSYAFSSMHRGGSGLKLNDGTDLKFLSVGWCLMFVFGLVHLSLN